jgi:hypothetical protein
MDKLIQTGQVSRFHNVSTYLVEEIKIKKNILPEALSSEDFYE